jgi:hypothetical protein
MSARIATDGDIRWILIPNRQKKMNASASGV